MTAASLSPLPDLLLPSAERAFRDEVRAVVSARVAPLATAMEARGPHNDTTMRAALSETGWLGVTIGSRYGGLGLGHIARTVILHEVTRSSPAAGAALQASILGAAPIEVHGSDSMRSEWLPEIAAGRCWPTIAVTDPDQGSHILAMNAVAKRSASDYLITGEKTFVGNAGIGDVHCVVARTGKRGRPDSLTAFLVDARSRGVEVATTSLNGLHGFSVDTLRFNQVRVPRNRIIGQVGDGLAVAQIASLVYGRLNLAAVACGIHESMLEVTARWVTARSRYGGHLSDMDTVRHRIAEMQSSLMGAQAGVRYAAQLLDLGVPCDEWLYQAKLVAHRAGTVSSEHAKQLHGGHAARPGVAIEQLRRDFDLVHAPAGPDDIQLLRLAQWVLGPNRPQWSAQYAALRARTPWPRSSGHPIMREDDQTA